jgi:hypothetical protein
VQRVGILERGLARKDASDVKRAVGRSTGVDVDVIVIAAEGGTVWHLTDLLGCSMGNIRENASHQFTIYPEGHAFETMADIQRGPHASLDAALAEIERYTRGVCRRSTGEDQP